MHSVPAITIMDGYVNNAHSLSLLRDVEWGFTPLPHTSVPSPSPRSLLGTAHLSSGFGTPRTPMVEEVGHKVPFSGGASGHGAPTTSPRLSREFCLVVVVRVCCSATCKKHCSTSAFTAHFQHSNPPPFCALSAGLFPFSIEPCVYCTSLYLHTLGSVVDCPPHCSAPPSNTSGSISSTSARLEPGYSTQCGGRHAWCCIQPTEHCSRDGAQRPHHPWPEPDWRHGCQLGGAARPTGARC